MAGRRRLRDGDVLRFGSSELLFRAPALAPLNATVPGDDALTVALSPAQQRVLTALCRPCRDRGACARPATNRQIAEELFLSVAAVEDHVRALFAKLGVEDLPQNEKRLRLVERAPCRPGWSPATSIERSPQPIAEIRHSPSSLTSE